MRRGETGGGINKIEIEMVRIRARLKQEGFWRHVWAPLMEVLERVGMRTRCAINAGVGGIDGDGSRCVTSDGWGWTSLRDC